MNRRQRGIIASVVGASAWFAIWGVIGVVNHTVEPIVLAVIVPACTAVILWIMRLGMEWIERGDDAP